MNLAPDPSFLIIRAVVVAWRLQSYPCCELGAILWRVALTSYPCKFTSLLFFLRTFYPCIRRRLQFGLQRGCISMCSLVKSAEKNWKCRFLCLSQQPKTLPSHISAALRSVSRDEPKTMMFHVDSPVSAPMRCNKLDVHNFVLGFFPKAAAKDSFKKNAAIKDCH